MRSLSWSINHKGKGNLIAQAGLRQYSIAWEGALYRVRVDGYPIGSADTLAGAKAIAQAHHDRPIR